MGARAWRQDVFQDWRVNGGASKSQIVLALFRQVARWHRGPRRRWHGPATALYTVLVGWVLGIELPPETQVGPRLCLYHAQAVVINKHTRIGADCILRVSTTLGNVRRDDDCPVLGDGVELGANVVVIGRVDIGAGARVGAGAVVTKDVPAGAVAVGNPARVLERSPAA